MGDDVSSGDAAGAARAGSPGAITELTDKDDLGASPGAGPQRQYRSPARSPWAFFRETLVLFAVALAVALLLKSFVVQPFYIPSSSMENTLLIGDRVLVNKLVYHLRPIHRGDIVVFNGQGSWDPPAESPKPSHDLLMRIYDGTLAPAVGWVKSLFGIAPAQIDYIKRVIGLPGDHVACCNDRGELTVNGVALHETRYLTPGAQPSQYQFSVVVPPGRLWVMGDNRPESADSRLHQCGYPDPDTVCAPYDRDGTIPENKVVGRAFMILWPPGQLRVLRIPPTFFQPALARPIAGSVTVARRTVPRRAGAAAHSRGAAAPSAPASAAWSQAGMPVRPAPSYPALVGGFAAAAPLTVLRRRFGRLGGRFHRSQAGRFRRSRVGPGRISG